MLHLNDTGLLRQQCYINGQWVDATEQLEIDNPSTGKVIAVVPKLGAIETRLAVKAAKAALPGWKKLTAKDRAKILIKWANLMLEHEQDLAKIMTLEQGKPLSESVGEIRYAASFLEWFGEEAKRVYGDVIPSFSQDKRIIVTKEAIGVCAAITPWNFPSAMITRKAGPALAAGCTIVVKPAEQTPLCALALAELAERAGVPAGVFNVVIGDPVAIGGELTSNSDVRKLSFTGSTAIGKLLYQQCAKDVKKISLELGGNAPFIVFDDADIEAAVEGALVSKYRNAGQTCVCTNRMLIQSGVYDDFCQRLAKRVEELKIGDGFDVGVSIGPMIDSKAVAKVSQLIDNAVSLGAEVILGGSPIDDNQRFFPPTILKNVDPEAAILHEEIFGPVAPIVSFESEDDVVALANATPFGLAAYFYSRDIGRVWRIAEALEYGMVGINTGLISTEVAPFGGVKESGLGREGSHYGIDDYMEVKYLCVGGL
ncbi:NAD-dependent succinate-semialdehyde dehydrogenase [Amphritea sp. 1_MG-2023]|uniref:NAD-dependent succinate-semialdehyde dehydrogenase n=1 Tax=Amphritea sp. 1_MG-2023 TaxID=3062670 RepID=UPI0026E1DE8F|nr:NAD-dependent succinate-semialdehyde dehydrogenase [Amphritea sp. 1_MG-2023]MDO6563305.1 NAD-dependent succinate-semialdehyde dehydrogenase [Amphritea sp. 1_MG-2023]